MDFKFSTFGIDAKHRFEYWTDAICTHCLRASSAELTGNPFSGYFSSRNIGHISISAFSAPPHRWSRRAEHLRQDGSEDLWLCYIKNGTAVMKQGDREVRLQSGDIALYDAARTFEAIEDSRETILIRLPRRTLLRMAPDAEKLTARVINDQKPGGVPLRTLLDQAVSINFESARPAAAEKFSEAVMNLTTFALEFQRGDLGSAREDDLYSRVVAYIHRNFQDPDLSVEALAMVFHASSRTISRAFARRQQTPMGLVWKVRLENSQRALAEGRARTVTTAAFDNGFSSVSHFSRSFRKAFGVTPHTVIAQ